ncbi:MAG: trypsin-like peptidase domain-containing protein [Rhodobacter sp.]|nr:trypsin-like peptidase domain-containing protein [Paracoccaceae bacterium]MCC0076620.1 trypsin-like peptidase domain-containing protein [Rhodobacter sp.]
MKSRILMLGLALSFSAGSALAQPYVEVVNTAPATASSPFDTVEGRRAVTPLPFPIYDNSSSNLNLGPVGEPTTSPGAMPAEGSAAEAQALYADQWALLTAPAPAGAVADGNFGGSVGAPNTFTQYCENCGSEPNLNYPQLAMGALFFTSAQGNGASCSATVINENLIVTAAHCCYSHATNQGEQSGMNSDFVFVPAYRDGAAPLGAFDWSSLRYLGSYVNRPRRVNDICLIQLRPDAEGHPVSYYTGWLGNARNYPYTVNLHAVGYPGNIGDGQFQQLCTSTTARPPRRCERNNVLNMGCSMTYGASGGAWLLAYRNGSFVNAVVSGYDSEACTGPFGSAFNGPRFVDGNFGRLCNGDWC